jgi:hypothetical protein
MIYGIGTDICDVRRIRASLDRHGERFAHKILSDAELVQWRARSARWPERGVRFLATRFLGQGGLQQGDRPGHAHAHELAPVREAAQWKANPCAAWGPEGLV